MPSLSDRLEGALIGLLVGDAFGVPYEFRTPAQLRSAELVWRGHGTYDQPAGTWSDDGSLTLALLDSLLESGGRFQPGRPIRSQMNSTMAPTPRNAISRSNGCNACRMSCQWTPSWVPAQTRRIDQRKAPAVE